MKKKYFVQVIGTRARLLAGHIRKLGCKADIITKPQEISAEADICLASGVYYLIKPEYLRVARLGIWGFHESALPEGRGWAPLQWTVLKGKKELVVSFFELTEEMDSGRLLGQERCPISKTDVLEDLREKALALMCRLIDNCLLKFLNGDISPYEQTGEPVFYRKRTPLDSKLDASKTLSESWDLIRVCDNEEYPAWFEINGQKIIVKRHKK